MPLPSKSEDRSAQTSAFELRATWPSSASFRWCAGLTNATHIEPLRVADSPEAIRAVYFTDVLSNSHGAHSSVGISRVTKGVLWPLKLIGSFLPNKPIFGKLLWRFWRPPRLWPRVAKRSLRYGWRPGGVGVCAGPCRGCALFGLVAGELREGVGGAGVPNKARIEHDGYRYRCWSVEF